MLTVGSLFAGIGGFDLGFERAGMRTVWFCEAEPYCQRVLAKHWPGVPCYPDVVALKGSEVERVDVLCGGFPCQDLSVAGAGAGIDGTRSGLWSEYARLIGEIRPKYVAVENVSALLGRGLGRVLGDLAAIGYDAEWDCLPASAFGAPHPRDRIWIVAYPHRSELREQSRRCGGTDGADSTQLAVDGEARSMADADQAGREGSQVVNGQSRQSEALGDGEGSPGQQWLTEPDVGRVADGVPHRVDRLSALGNALVPQIAEWIGRRIVAYEESANGCP